MQDILSRDQNVKEAVSAIGKGLNGVQQTVGTASDAAAGALAGKGRTQGLRAPVAAQGGGRSLALVAIALAVSVVALLGALGPMLHPRAFDGDSTGVARALEDWSPLPQAALLFLVLALAVAAALIAKQRPSRQTVMPAGVTTDSNGVLCDANGVPLPRGYKIVGDTIICTSSGSALPKNLSLGPGGVLLHSASGRPVPHSCSIGPHGGLLSSDGRPLPDSMSVGPNCCLVAADGTVLSPDLQPVPAGFVLSPCSRKLLRPNGKPVPRGVHVGPGFRLLKPTGELMPDGVKIGPCGTIICLDGTILSSDGAAVSGGFVLSPDKTQIIDPQGRPLDEGYDMGPNCTLISKDGRLLTALGKMALGKDCTIGPLGNLLLQGQPVPAGAVFNHKGELIGADGVTVLRSYH